MFFKFIGAISFFITFNACCASLEAQASSTMATANMLSVTPPLRNEEKKPGPTSKPME